jgi:hypothetical protein
MNARKEIHRDYRAWYVLFGRLGIVWKISDDGTPWTMDGEPYFLRSSESMVGLTIGRYALHAHWLKKS